MKIRGKDAVCLALRLALSPKTRRITREEKEKYLQLFTLRAKDIPAAYYQLWLIEEAREDIGLAAIQAGRVNPFGLTRGVFNLAKRHLNLWLLLQLIERDCGDKRL